MQKKLIEENTDSINGLKALLKEFEQELYEAHKRVFINKDGEKEVKRYYE
jgi:hypothetical protein